MPKDPARLVATNLKRLRTARGLTQATLARRSELDRTFISLCERAHRNVTVRSIFALASGLQCDPRALIAPLKTAAVPRQESKSR